jgi:hypothetical protein
MSLRTKQSRFVEAVGKLIAYAYSNGYQLTLGDGYRDPRADFPYSSKSSRHTMRLAIDFNLFRKNSAGKWVYCMHTGDFTALGKYWVELGGIWGGSFNDGNHFEWPL